MNDRAHVDSRFVIRADSFEPGYLKLHRSGVLQERIDDALAALEQCRLCPRQCGVDRAHGETGICQTGRRAAVSSFAPHHGEENCLRGWRGSGTIFFWSCNLRCVFCQNFDISQMGRGRPVSPRALADLMLQLQSMGCHNINFVTPSHVVAQILEALPHAVEGGLRVPLVYNTSAYDAIETLRLLDGVIDIYMPDCKFSDQRLAQLYLTAADYPAVARKALREMHRQVGPLKTDERGIALRGVLVRHLVMPGALDETAETMRFLAEQLSVDTYVNVMPQYRPAGKVGGGQFPDIDRPLRSEEWREALRLARDSGLWRLDQR